MRRISRLLRYFKPYWFYLLASVISMALVGLLDAFRLLLIGPILDQVLNPASQAKTLPLLPVPVFGHHLDLRSFVPRDLHNVWTVVTFALIISTIFKGIFDYAGTYLANYAGFGMTTDLRNDLHTATLRRSVGFFQQYSTGTLLSAIVNDVERVQFAMSSVLAEFLQQFFTFIFIGIAVFGLGRRLSWVLLIFVPFIIASARRVGNKVRVTTRKGQDKLAEINNLLHETITGIRVVKAFCMEMWEMRRFREAARRLFKANLRSAAAFALNSPMMDAFGAIAIALLILLGRDSIKHGYLSEGFFIAFIIAVFKLYEPVRKFGQFNNNFQQALGASEQIFNFLDAQDDVRQKPDAVKLPAFQRGIRFEHVSFSYSQDEGERDVLRDINLDIVPGEVVAVVGSSGSGKTTLVQLLPRFFDVSRGRLLIDGHDVRDVTVSSLRSQIAIVTQDTILFNDTVRNNIAYGQPQIPMEAVEEAARAALAHDFIMASADGYDSVIGERGLRLSGGERQRLSIARAILKNAPILILDEATSALDAESEALVQSALQNLMAGRTVFVIAHRLSTVRRADRILVLENGMITDEGSHELLLGRAGTYRRLYDLQFEDIEAVSGTE
ncbi:MAG TPA: ABC transporter ATP-binding protein [Terriglobales bacterium]|jgi:subfamily B ATP-binding cassette protein MsbA|nr:ABC transporter ATP-binding protein [Terriglobales bacterium]